jgi:hypothetical protein
MRNDELRRERDALLANEPRFFAGDLTAPARVWNKFANAVRGGTTASGKHTLGKPFVISETGAGGIFEWDHNATDAKWTLK